MVWAKGPPTAMSAMLAAGKSWASDSAQRSWYLVTGLPPSSVTAVQVASISVSPGCRLGAFAFSGSVAWSVRVAVTFCERPLPPLDNRLNHLSSSGNAAGCKAAAVSSEPPRRWKPWRFSRPADISYVLPVVRLSKVRSVVDVA